MVYIETFELCSTQTGPDGQLKEGEDSLIQMKYMEFSHEVPKVRAVHQHLQKTRYKYKQMH